MPKSIALRETASQLPRVDLKEGGIAVDPRPLWYPPKGVDYLNRKNRIDAQYCPEMLNMYLDRGISRSRQGTAQVGDPADSPVMGVVLFVTGTGIGFLLRFTTTRLERWTGTVWEHVSTSAFTGGTTDYFTYTAFNNKLIFSNGVDGMFEYDPMVGSYKLIEGAPRALHLTTFANRVLASAAGEFPYRLQWCVGRNSNDWEGIGSGFEDLLSTPGGMVDQLMGVFPLTDDTALMVRSNSIWQVAQTGDPDAPFRFGRLHPELGTRARHSIVSAPGGIIFLAEDDVYVVTESSITPIGMRMKDRFLTEITDPIKVRGAYRPDIKEYWLCAGANRLYRYSFQDQGWTPHEYPFGIRWMDRAIFSYGGITWDEMVGTWDAATTTWNALLGEARPASFFFATTEAAGNVIQEVDTTEDAYIEDGYATIGIEFQTPILVSLSPLEKTKLMEFQLEYEANEEQTIVAEYSTDGGATWTAYSTKSLAITEVPFISRMMPGDLSRQNLMLKFSSALLGDLKVISGYPFLQVEEKVEA